MGFFCFSFLSLDTTQLNLTLIGLLWKYIRGFVFVCFKMFLKWDIALSLKTFMMQFGLAFWGWCISTNLHLTPFHRHIHFINQRIRIILPSFLHVWNFLHHHFFLFLLKLAVSRDLPVTPTHQHCKLSSQHFCPGAQYHWQQQQTCSNPQFICYTCPQIPSD